MTFKKGQSGNPNGRPKVASDVRDLARTKGKAAFEKIVALMEDEDKKVQLAAAKEILDRAYGRSPQAVTGEGGEGPAIITVKWLKEDDNV